jgi:hypothetical protein
MLHCTDSKDEFVLRSGFLRTICIRSPRMSASTRLCSKMPVNRAIVRMGSLCRPVAPWPPWPSSRGPLEGPVANFNKLRVIPRDRYCSSIVLGEQGSNVQIAITLATKIRIGLWFVIRWVRYAVHAQTKIKPTPHLGKSISAREGGGGARPPDHLQILGGFAFVAPQRRIRATSEISTGRNPYRTRGNWATARVTTGAKDKVEGRRGPARTPSLQLLPGPANRYLLANKI